MSEPKVYVACLSCYNNGTLHGHWLDADDSLEDEHTKAFELNEDGFSPCGGEEFIVHDTEGFEGYNLGEVSVSEAMRIGSFLTEHGEAGAAALNNFGDIEQAEKAMEEDYQGEFDSLEEWAEQFAEDCYDLKNMGTLAQYIDWERYARDCELGGDIWSSRGPSGKIHVFHNS